MDRATIRRIYNACDPGEPLAPNDPRNVDVVGIPGVREAIERLRAR